MTRSVTFEIIKNESLRDSQFEKVWNDFEARNLLTVTRDNGRSKVIKIEKSNVWSFKFLVSRDECLKILKCNVGKFQKGSDSDRIFVKAWPFKKKKVANIDMKK